MKRASDVPPEVERPGFLPVIASIAAPSAPMSFSFRVRKTGLDRSRHSSSKRTGASLPGRSLLSAAALSSLPRISAFMLSSL